ncbi:MAG: CHAD domain-containing protein [Ardenticatenaceae bacterium]|nr:CHAD domain-containing protein [Ardenticatenaceae bacterium]
MMVYCLQKQEPIALGIRRIILERLDAIEQDLTDETLDRDKAVHNARKTCKRLRAVLRLVRDEIGPDLFRRENICFRDISRRLSVARDSFVLIETLTMLDAQYPDTLPASFVANARVQLEERYQAVWHRFWEQEGVIEDVLREIRAARVRLETLPITGDDFGVFARSLRRVYRRGRRAMAAAYEGEGVPHAFHEWRKRVKYLWYQVEILQDAWTPLLLAVAGELHALSGYLGDDHDLAELRRVLLQNPTAFGAESDLSVLLALIAQRREALETAAYPLGQRIFAESSQAFVARMGVYWAAWQAESDVVLQTASDSQQEPPVQERLLTTRQAAELEQISVEQVRHLIYSGKLAAFKLGGRWVIEREAMEQARR